MFISQLLIAVSQAAAITVDQYFKNVSLVFSADLQSPPAIIPNNHTVWRDASVNAATVTATANPGVGAFTPYNPNGWSGYFVGGVVGLTATLTAKAPGTGSVTYEAWVMPQSLPNADNILLSTRSGATTDGIDISINSSRKVTVQHTSVLYTSTASVTVSQWTHIAVVRNGTTNWSVYINGTLDGTFSAALTLSATNFAVVPSTTSFYAGSVADVRITNDAVYTSNFAVPVSKLTAIANTSILTCQDTRVVDRSANAFTISKGSTGCVVQSRSPYPADIPYSPELHGTSIITPGSAQLTFPSSTAFDISSGAFTLECWFFTARSGGGSSVLFRKLGGSVEYNLSVTTGNGIIFNTPANGNINIGSVRSFEWNHIAIVGNGTTLSGYINGKQLITGQSYTITYDGAANLAIGPALDMISEARLVKGVQVYTGNFEPPTSRLTAIAGTSFLFDPYSGFVDQRGCLTMGNGNSNTIRMSAEQVKYNPASISFGGAAADYINFVNENLLSVRGDFTYEAWIYPRAAQGTDATIFNIFPTSGANLLMGYISTTGFGLTASGSVIANSSTIPTVGAWNHVAFVRSGTTVTVYVNGVSGASGTFSGDIPLPSVAVGQSWIGSNGTGITKFNGLMDDIRWTTGYARYTGNFTPPTAALPTTRGTDPYFDAVTLLLQGKPQSRNLSQYNNLTVLDTSYNALAVTRTSNPQLGSFSPYSSASWSTIFNGSTDYLTSPSDASLSFGSGDFTIETFVLFNDFPTSGSRATLISKWNTSNFEYLAELENNSGTQRFTFSYSITGSAGALVIAADAASLRTRIWYHVAFVRSGTNLRIYLDGVDIGGSSSLSATFFTGTALLTLGRIGDGSGRYLSGCLSSSRIIKGTALYTGSFVPSTTPLTAIANTSLLTCQDNRYKDNSTNNFAITPNGSPQIRSSSPFAPALEYSPALHGGSIYVNGTTDDVRVATNSLFSFGTGDFTVEFWHYPTQAAWTANSRLFATGSGGMRLTPAATGLVTYATFAGTAIVSGSVALQRNAWNHIAVSRVSGTSTLYINGVSAGSAADANNFTNSGCFVGTDNGTNRVAAGYYSDVRVTRAGVYTSAFTPNTSPLSPVTGTQLLLAGTSAGVVDASGNNNLLTISGAKTSSVITKFGSGSLYLDGASAITTPANPNNAARTGNFTFECWAYRTANSTAGGLFSTAPTDAAGSLVLRVSNGTLEYWLGTSANLVSGPNSGVGSLPLNSWTHLALVREGTAVNLYVDGTVVATAASTSAVDLTQSAAGVGRNFLNTANYYFNGYMDDVRYTPGIARYTSNFIPPSKLLLK